MTESKGANFTFVEESKGANFTTPGIKNYPGLGHTDLDWSRLNHTEDWHNSGWTI